MRMLWFHALLLYTTCAIGEVVNARDGYLTNNQLSVYSLAEDVSVEEFWLGMSSNTIHKEGNSTSVGFTNDYIWMVFDIQGLDEGEFLLELENPHIDQFTLYSYYNNVFKLEAAGGVHIPFYTRSIVNKNFVLTLPAYKSAIFLLKIDKRHSYVTVPLTIWEQSAFFLQDSREKIYHTVIFTVILIIVLSSFMLAVSMQYPLFHWYAGYGLLVFLFMFASHGYAFQYIYPKFPIINDYIRPIVAVAILLIFTFYSMALLELKKRNAQKLRRIHCVLGVLIAAIFIWVLFLYLISALGSVLLNAFLFSLFILVMIVVEAAVRVWKYQRQIVTLFLASFSFPMLAVFLFVGMENGSFIDLTSYCDPISVGFGGEMVVLAAAMVMKFNSETKRNIRIGMGGRLLRQVNKISLSESEVYIRDIVFIRSEEPYLEFHLKGRAEPVIERMTMGFLMGILPSCNFVQIHEFYIVNWKYVKSKCDAHVRLKTKKELPLSKIYTDKR